MLIFLPLHIILFLYVETLFLWLNMSPDVASRSASYVRIVLPGHIFLTIQNCYQKYLSAQREVRMQMCANLISLGFYLPIAFLMIGKGIQGIAWSMSFNYIVRWATLQVLIYRSKYKENLVSLWRPSSRKSLFF